MALPLKGNAKLVKFCENLTGALANARVYTEAALDRAFSRENLEVSRMYCNSTDVVERLKVERKEKVLYTDSTGTRRELEAYVWFTGRPEPFKVKYYFADAFLEGTPILLNFVLRVETPVTEAEFETAIERYRENAPVLSAPLLQ